MSQKPRSFMSKVADLSGRLFCSMGWHKYKSATMNCVHPIFQCTRPGCDHAYAEYQGGCRLGIKSVPQISSQLSDHVSKDFL